MLKRKAFVFILPCAGITLIRFYGYNLRFRPIPETPRETLKIRPFWLKDLCRFKITKKMINGPVTFLRCLSYYF